MLKMCTNYTWVYRPVSANEHLQICCLILVQSLVGNVKLAFAIVLVCFLYFAVFCFFRTKHCQDELRFGP